MQNVADFVIVKDDAMADIPHLGNGDFRDFSRGKLQGLKLLRMNYFCLVRRFCRVDLVFVVFDGFGIESPKIFWPCFIKAASYSSRWFWIWDSRSINCRR